MTDREALIQLRVPAALKSRWVRESRAAGVKLTDWIISKVEPKKMTVFKVPKSLDQKYKGAGHALAATLNGQLIDFVYLRDVLPELDEEAGITDTINTSMITDPRLGPAVRRLQALGQVHVGMLSAWEFCEL